MKTWCRKLLKGNKIKIKINQSLSLNRRFSEFTRSTPKLSKIEPLKITSVCKTTVDKTEKNAFFGHRFITKTPPLKITFFGQF